MSDIYRNTDATGLAALVANKEISAEELLETALAQVAAINPELNAVVMLQEDTARSAIAAGLPEGPFRGVPFLLKDLGAEAIDYPTNNGSGLMRGSQHRYDSELYLRLRKNRAGYIRAHHIAGIRYWAGDRGSGLWGTNPQPVEHQPYLGRVLRRGGCRCCGGHRARGPW